MRNVCLAACLAALAVTATVTGQRLTGPDGAFQSSADYVVGGAWNFNKATNPVCLEGPLNDLLKTCLTAGDPVATNTLTLPAITGGLPVALNCGATGSGNQTCSPTAATAATKIYAGSSTLSGSAAIITFPTAFAATTSYQCVANDITTRANPVQMVSTSTTTATITNTTGATDVINWTCIGQ